MSTFLTVGSISLPSSLGKQSRKTCETTRGLTQYVYGYDKWVSCEVGEPNGESIGGVWGVDVSLERGIV